MRVSVATRFAFASILGSILALTLVGQSSGQGRLRANVYVTQQAIPRNMTERSLIGFARRAHARILQETTAEPLPERRWVAEMITSFNRAPGDLEFHVLWYDIEDGPRRFVRDMSTFVNDRSQKTFVTRLNLPRGRGRAEGFQPNRRFEAVVTVRRAEVGRVELGLAGEAIRNTGEVSFSDEEAN
jgi:hypothetical protein